MVTPAQDAGQVQDGNNTCTGSVQVQDGNDSTGSVQDTGWQRHLHRIGTGYRMATTIGRVTPGIHNTPSVSAQTVRNRLREAGLRACKAGPQKTSPATTSPLGTNPSVGGPDRTGNNIASGHKPLRRWTRQDWQQHRLWAQTPPSVDQTGLATTSPLGTNPSVGGPDRTGNNIASGHKPLRRWTRQDWQQHRLWAQTPPSVDQTGLATTSPLGTNPSVGGPDRTGNNIASGHKPLRRWTRQDWQQHRLWAQTPPSVDQTGLATTSPLGTNPSVGGPDRTGNNCSSLTSRGFVSPGVMVGFAFIAEGMSVTPRPEEPGSQSH
ncbi:uncharacterized protein LOC127923198 [Oncorhynchus keta]|uniref:uncharacterized protein LOC127923198 n=1 Tax=Oncorhynchus keta TaxID=8018 RepID=UPI00227C35F0|nr:uncharacterized protein LOC127923198 [Oncorhynchus keta]